MHCVDSLIDIYFYCYGNKLMGTFVCSILLKHFIHHYLHIWAGSRKKVPYSFPVCGSSNVHEQSPIWFTDIHFCLKLPQSLYYISANSKCSGETALMHRLVWVFFAGHLCDKYPFLMCWHIFWLYRSNSIKFLAQLCWIAWFYLT